MASMSCPQCGTPVDPRSTFCGYCGYSMKATEAATSYPPQGPQRGGYSSPDNAPPPRPIGNMPSSSTYLPNGSPSSPGYPAGSSPSQFTFPASGSPPPPPYQPGNNPSSPIYPASGSPPPPPYQSANNAMRFPSGAYPGNEANVPPLQPQLPPPQQRRRGKKGLLAILVVAALVILGGAVLAGVLYTTHSPLLAKVGLGSSTPTQSTTAGLAATATPAQSTTPTATTDTSTSTPSTTPTLTSTSSTPTAVSTSTSTSNYSATQPGPGCDTNGGTWTPIGISNIHCGTQISVSSGNARGYLYLQLPNNAAFAPNNSIGILGAVQAYGPDCVGLVEQDANTGFLAEYCDDGNWYIYSISSAGATIKTLAHSITSTRSSEQLLLTLSGSTLTFSIDTEVHKINVSPIQPTKVAISYINIGGSSSTTITNFSYTTQAS